MRANTRRAGLTVVQVAKRRRERSGFRVTSLLVVFLSSTATAGGFAIGEHDASATGRGGTGVGALTGASAVHYNPAALSRVFSIDGAVGATGIMPLASAVDPETARSESARVGVRVPPHVFAAYGNGQYGFGLGFNAPFGGGLRWQDDFRGRFEIIEQNLQVLAGHAGAAWQIVPQLSVGATVSLYSASVGVERRVDFVSSEGTAVLGGSGMGFGAAFGLSYAPSERLRFGVTGRLPTTVALNGRAHFSGVPDAFATTLQDQDIQASLPLPGRIAVGGGLYLDATRLFLDVDYTMWSSFERFAVEFAENASLNVNQPRNWKNAFAARVGAERDLTDVATLRAGLFFDQKTSPANTLSPSQPDSDRVGLSLGAGKDVGPVQVDGAYMFVLFLPRDAEGEAFPARYNASAHLLALTFRLRTPPGVASRRADTSSHAPLLDTSAD